MKGVMFLDFPFPKLSQFLESIGAFDGRNPSPIDME